MAVAVGQFGGDAKYLTDGFHHSEVYKLDIGSTEYPTGLSKLDHLSIGEPERTVSHRSV